MYKHNLSFFPCVIPLKENIVTNFLFWDVKWAVKLLHKPIKKSMLLFDRALNQSLDYPVSVNANSLHYVGLSMWK